MEKGAEFRLPASLGKAAVRIESVVAGHGLAQT